MSHLPRWASVALAARCGRILTPKLDLKWPNAPAEVRHLFLSAAADAESAASEGLESDELQTVGEELTKVVGMFELRIQGLDKMITRPMPAYEAMRDSMPADEGDQRIVREILDVGARSARAATATGVSVAYQEAVDAVNWTLSVLEDLQESQLHDHVAALTQRLHDLCEAKKATKGTTVRWKDDDWDMTIPRPWWRFW